MKTVLRLAIFALILSLPACDDDEEKKPSNQVDLRTFLDGTFTVEQVSYTGEVNFVITTIPVSGVDPNAVGAYIFSAEEATVTYNAKGILSFEPPFGQSPIEVPVEVGSLNARFNVINDSSFEIEDETWGPMLYTVNSRTANTLVATTSLASDSAGFDMDMRINFSK